jgi:hypothetical protein
VVTLSRDGQVAAVIETTAMHYVVQSASYNVASGGHLVGNTNHAGSQSMQCVDGACTLQDESASC